MRTLVTGGSGFLGSHVVGRLEEAGHDVAVIRSADYDLTSAAAGIASPSTRDDPSCRGRPGASTSAAWTTTSTAYDGTKLR